MYCTNSTQNMFVLPGRLRICITGLNGNRKFADNIDRYLSGVQGIRKITANQYTGNVLVFFTEEYIDILSIEKLIYEARYKIDFEDAELLKQTSRVHYRNPAHEQLETEKNIKGVYHKLIPIVFSVSLLSFIASGNLLLPLSVLVLTNPYMLGLSSRVALRSAAANARLNGILVNNPSKLEVAGKADTVVFEMTDFLTTGKCKVSNIIPIGRNSVNRILMLAASCARNSEGPVADALVGEAENRKLELKHVSGSSFCIERGISCMIDGKDVFVGSKKQLTGRSLFTGSHLVNERKIRHLGQYPVFVAYNRKIIGVFGFQYNINENCVPAIEAMRETGIEDIKIITEEDEETVKNIALEAGIDSYDADLEPESKMGKIAELIGEGRTIALINKNSDMNSDFVITNGDLRSIPKIIGLSKYTMEVVSQSYIISLGLDAVGILLVFTNSITPYTALLYKFVNSFIILLNARKPVKYKIN